MENLELTKQIKDTRESKIFIGTNNGEDCIIKYVSTVLRLRVVNVGGRW